MGWSESIDGCLFQSPIRSAKEATLVCIQWHLVPMAMHMYARGMTHLSRWKDPNMSKCTFMDFKWADENKEINCWQHIRLWAWLVSPRFSLVGLESPRTTPRFNILTLQISASFTAYCFINLKAFRVLWLPFFVKQGVELIPARN